MNTHDKILPLILETYGNGSMPRALAAHLAPKIDEFEPGDPDIYGELEQQRQRMIMETCWIWFSGGTTAEDLAGQIEEALR